MKDLAACAVTDQMCELLGELISLKSRLEAVLPEDLARLKERLRKLHPDGGPKRAADYDLFYRIGVILSRQREPLTMSQLSAALDVPMSTATRMVDWLVENNYVERLSDPEDRRVVRVALTDTGEELYQTINEFIKQRAGQVLSRFSPEEQEELVLLLRRLVQALAEVME